MADVIQFCQLVATLLKSLQWLLTFLQTHGLLPTRRCVSQCYHSTYLNASIHTVNVVESGSTISRSMRACNLQLNSSNYSRRCVLTGTKSNYFRFYSEHFI